MTLEPPNIFHQGNSPLLISIPHSGTLIPDQISRRLTADAKNLPDTDWFVDQLYHWVRETGAGVMIAGYSRYVIDLNRPPDDKPLYSTRTTGLVPLVSFSGESVYFQGQEPEPAECLSRTEKFWKPYHAFLASELNSIRDTAVRVLPRRW
jgi:N-formylglutamate deformylase